jgi:hypothetical protein
MGHCKFIHSARDTGAQLDREATDDLIICQVTTTLVETLFKKSVHFEGPQTFYTQENGQNGV